MQLPYDTQNKSALLTKLTGVETFYGYEGICLVYHGSRLIGSSISNWVDENGPHVDVYHESNMALAWQITALAQATLPQADQIAFDHWWEAQDVHFDQAAHKLQQEWLDKVLELALESNQIELYELSFAV